MDEHKRASSKPIPVGSSMWFHREQDSFYDATSKGTTHWIGPATIVRADYIKGYYKIQDRNGRILAMNRRFLHPVSRRSSSIGHIPQPADVCVPEGSSAGSKPKTKIKTQISDDDDQDADDMITQGTTMNDDEAAPSSDPARPRRRRRAVDHGPFLQHQPPGADLLKGRMWCRLAPPQNIF